MPREDGALFGTLHGKPAAIVTKLEGAPELAPGVEHCIEVGQMLRAHAPGRTRLHGLSAESAQPAVVAGNRADHPAVSGAASNASCCRPNWRIRKRSSRSADYAALPEGPCHADLFRDNAMFAHAAPDTGHEVRLGGFFDFYFAGCDKWLFDVAVTVNDWCIDLATGKLDDARTEAMLRAYQTVRPFTRRRRPPLGRHAASGRVPLLGLAPV